MLRSLQLSTWNIVKSQEYFARPKYYASPEKIHQPSGISIYWWHLEPVVSGLSVSWAMWHEADGWEIWKHGRDQWRHRCLAAGDQNLVTAPTAETRKHETGCLHCRRGCLNISQYCHQHLLQTGENILVLKGNKSKKHLYVRFVLLLSGKHLFSSSYCQDDWNDIYVRFVLLSNETFSRIFLIQKSNWNDCFLHIY